MFRKLLDVHDVANWVKPTGHNTIKGRKYNKKKVEEFKKKETLKKKQRTEKQYTEKLGIIKKSISKY